MIQSSLSAVSVTFVFAAPVSVVFAMGSDRLMLSSEEALRRKRLLRITDQMRFTAAHVLKRLLLSRYLGLCSKNLVFSKNLHGKPYLKDHAIHFSLSHSGDWVTLAIDPVSSVGVDVEVERDARTWDSVVPTIRSADEEPLSPIKSWTAKEALLKAYGTGLTFDPRLVSVKADGLEFTGRSEHFCMTGAWYAPNDNHLIAVAAGAGHYRWRVAHCLDELMALTDNL